MFSRRRHRSTPAPTSSGRPTTRFAWCAAALLSVTLAGCTASAVPVPRATPTATANPVPSVRAWVTAYFMIDTRTGLRLTRERQSVPASGAAVAVEAMIAGPVDPDYSTPWNPQSKVLSVSEASGLVTVDLSGDAVTANIGSEGAALMIQQLVWTVTEAMGLPGAAVTLLIDGAAPGDLWGAVRWDEPVVRADPLDVRSLVQLDVPAEGEVFPIGGIAISGEAAVFEAHLPWRITAAAAEVASGFTMTSEGQRFAPFQFTVNLPPGDYVVQITEDDPSDGAAGTPMKDDRSFTVARVGLPGSGGA